MSNMSYCRFQNTFRDLVDCFDHMEDELSVEEELAKEALVDLCKNIVEDYAEWEDE